MDTEKHRRQAAILTESLDLAWADRDDVYVGANMFVYFSQLQIKKNDFRGPDVFIVLDTTRRVRKSWVVWEEGGRTPDVVIELVSPTTEDVDRGEKMRIYAKLLHVANYFIFDPLTLRLDAYLLDARTGEYTRIVPNADGDVACPRLGLRLGVRHANILGVDEDWLRGLDPHGRVLETPDEQARNEARLRSDAEKRLADALAEIERLKAHH